MTYNHCHMLRNIKDYHHMQYEVDPSHQSWEKGQCAYVHNLCTLCMNRIYAWTKTSTTCWETFRTTIICNMESIRATKIEKKANVHMCTINAHCARTRFFPDKRPCTFLSFIMLIMHAKFQKNPWSGSPGILVTNYQLPTIRTLTSTVVEN